MKRKRKAVAPAAAASATSTKCYQKLEFVAFCAARQAVLLNRRAGLERPEWTNDRVLASAKFCNIDRRDDAVTAELLAAISAHTHWGLREKVLACIALRFSSSRRGEAASLAALIESGRKQSPGDRAETPVQLAFATDQVKCGSGTYQMALNRKQVSTVLEATADAVVARVTAEGKFADVLEASDFVADHMTVGKRPQFSANETAKDFAYVEGLLHPASHHRCRLGPGAKKGLLLVRTTEGKALGIAGSGEEATVATLRAALRATPTLDWVETIDVEQALCEYSKYEAYSKPGGISANKTFTPHAGVVDLGMGGYKLHSP